MKTFKNKVVAITGAGNGIGRALAYELGRRGAKLALSDVDANGLETTFDQCEDRGFSVHMSVVDVSSKSEVDDWAESVAAYFGGVDAIINNAGVSLAGTVEKTDIDDFRWLMGINFWGVVHGTQAFLPWVLKSDDGHIANVSSVYGIIAVPGQSAYNASKFAVRGFTEALTTELQVADSNVVATVVLPGGVKTGIVRNARFSKNGIYGRDPASIVEEFETEMARTSPETAAQTIALGMLANKTTIHVGADSKLIALGHRLAPVRYTSIVSSLFKKKTKPQL